VIGRWSAVQAAIILASLKRSDIMPACEDVYGKVARVMVEVLNVDEDDVRPAATLQGDLGAESIDFLDIVFRLEREFRIRIPNGELFPDSLFRGDPDFVQDGRVTEQGMVELRSRMPHADLGDFDQDRRLSAISDLFTVDLVTRYIACKLAGGIGAGANGHEAPLEERAHGTNP
jgi:acyl carrier protein